MKLRGRLSYANVTSTLALCVALATGGAYAQSRIGTSEIRNRAVTGPKIQKNAIRGAVHVRNRTIPGRKIRGKTLNTRRFSAVDGSERGECVLAEDAFVECVDVTLSLPARGRALVVATGATYSGGGTAANGQCEVRENNKGQLFAQFPGEESVANTSGVATDGFARTLVSGPLPAGPVTFSLACKQSGPDDLRVDSPTIAAMALTHGRP